MHILTGVVSYCKDRSDHVVRKCAPEQRQAAVSLAVQLWESKMMQSKAMEDFRKNNINSSNFVLQLPASYSQADQELAGNIMQPETKLLTNKTNI